MKKNKIAIVRGKFLNKYDMQSYEPLINDFDITAFGSLTSYHDSFAFPVIKLPSPLDIPNFPFKIQLLNRLFIDAQYLYDLEKKLKGFSIAHSAEAYFHYTQQCLNAKKSGYVKKVVVTVWENIPFNNEGIWGRKKFKRIAIEEVDHFIAVSNGAKNALIAEGVNEQKISIIPPGIDTNIFKPRKKKNNGKINILLVGRLEEEKGIYDAVEALSLLLNDGNLKAKKIYLTIIGNGSQRKSLNYFEKQLGVENFIAHKSVPYENMPQEYQKADIFIAPSKSTKYWKEQFGMMLLEAQASGLPTVTTRSGAIEENIGDAGILVEEGDIKDLYESLKMLVSNTKLRVEYSRKARLRSEKLYDTKVVAKKIKDVYEKIL